MKRILYGSLTVFLLAGASLMAGSQAQTASTPLPAVATGAYRTLPPVPLYAGAAPLRADWPGKLSGEVKEVTTNNGETIFNITEPSYTAFLPDPARNTRTAVIIAPGGGFRQLSIKSEGDRVAIWLAERGVAAFVVKYRLVLQPGPQFSMMARMQEMPMNVAAEPGTADGIQALALVRQRAADYNIDPTRTVAIGFSAGAHVVSLMALNSNVAARPNYVAPIYGAPFGGIPPIPQSTAADKLPPIFLAMAQDDPLVANDVRAFYAQLFEKGYLPEMHLYMSGSHGFGMNVTNNTSDRFIDQFFMWMQAQGLTQKPGDPDMRPRGRGGRQGGGAPAGGTRGAPAAPAGRQ